MALLVKVIKPVYVASVAPELIRAPLDPEDPGPIPAKLKASA